MPWIWWAQWQIWPMQRLASESEQIPGGILWISITTDASMVNEDEHDIKEGRIPVMDHSLECSKGPEQGRISGAKLCISMSNISESCGGQKSENDFQ